MKQYLFVLVLGIGFTGCISGGTHGYIKGYHYNVTKDKLDKAVHQIIAGSLTIIRDSVNTYYNDSTNYISLGIIEKELPYTYVFRYYGGKEYWDTSKVSEIFIAYAYDKNRKGGSSGNGGIKWYDFNLKRNLTEPFEHEFIYKIDSLLGIKHVEE